VEFITNSRFRMQTQNIVPAAEQVSATPRSVANQKGTHCRIHHRHDLAFAEGRLVLVVPEGKTTPSNVSVFRLPFLVLTAPPLLFLWVLLALALSFPAVFSSACSLFAISWYSSTVFSTVPRPA